MDGVESELRHGPRPYEGYVSEVCEAFGCPPDVAERQDARLVSAIFDYRNAVTALELFNEGGESMKLLEKHPALLELLAEISRAQGD